ncbi:Ger(x)C family spore germination protein [Paenibacillus sp. DYY-L-2]|uniref:Ger(x)C family spore germination protein n=1 Tax=Paenibacillus sp. DYY-L-2 TaxID=3447013 RepID=UPI003F503C4B
MKTTTIFVKLGLVFLMLACVCGCWSSRELNNRGFTFIMLVDKAENGGVELTLGFPLPIRMTPGQAGGSSSQSGPPFSYITRTADNISQAFRVIQSDISRSISFGQTRNIVIGEKLAEDGIDSILEFVNRQPAFHLSANLFVMEGKVTDIKKTPLVFERFISDILSSFVARHSTLDTTAKDFMMAEYLGGDILLPLLKVNSKPEGEGGESEKNEWLASGGAAIMSAGKMSKLKLSAQELRGALWISSQLDTSIISIPSPSDGKEISVVAQGVGTKIRPKMKEGKLRFQINSTAKGYVLSSQSEIDLRDPKKLSQIQDALEQDIVKRLSQVIEKTRKAQSDSFLMSQYLGWRYPKTWNRLKNEWREYYASELPIDIKVNIELNQTGGAYRSTTQETSKEKSF